MNRRDLLKRGVPALGLAVLIGPGPALAVTRASKDELRRFLKSRYTYCDARVLARYWGQSVPEAKARIGRKIGWKDTDLLEGWLGKARKKSQSKATSLCRYHENGYEYSDIEVLAELWEMEVPETKLHVARKLYWGNKKVIDQQLYEAHRQGQAGGRIPDNQALRKYFDSNYTYCDAVVLGAYWGKSLADAKVRIGRKLGSGNRSVIEDQLRPARRKALPRAEKLCRYDHNGYTYADMEALGSYWGNGVSEAKTRTSLKLVGGYKKLLDSELKAARRRSGGRTERERELRKFYDSGYSYCDARVLGHYWGHRVDDAKARIGRKLNWGDWRVVQDMLRDARKKAAPVAPKVCPHTESGYRYRDMETLAGLWGESVGQTKVRVARKLVAGDKKAVDRALHVARK